MIGGPVPFHGPLWDGHHLSQLDWLLQQNTFGWQSLLAQPRSSSRSFKERDSNSHYSKSNSQQRKSSSYSKTSKRSRSKSKDYYEKNDRKKRARCSSTSSDNSSTNTRKKSSHRKEHTDALERIWKLHSDEFEVYRRNPQLHPDHELTKRDFQHTLFMLNFVGPQSEMDERWIKCWKAKMVELFKRRWQVKKTDYLMTIESSSHTHHQSKKQESDPNYGSSEQDFNTDNQSRKHLEKSLCDKERKEHPTSSSSEQKADRLGKVDSFTKKLEPSELCSSPSRMSNTSSVPSQSTDLTVHEVTSLLYVIADKFGSLEESVKLLHNRVEEAIASGEDPNKCIDDDTLLFLSLIEKKLENLLEDKSLSLYPRTISQEALNQLSPFLKSREKKLETRNFDIDLDVIARVTRNREVSDVMDFIKNALEYKQISNYTKDDILNIYLEVKKKQCQ